MLLPVTQSDSNKKHIKEVLPFQADDEAAVPYQEYTNVLYLYPESLNFSNYKGADSSARNILIGVSLMRSDGSPSERVPGACYPCWGTFKRVDEAYFAVQYHQRKPRFCALDEVKIELPYDITEQDHVLVTYYHVDCKPGAKDCALTTLGHSVIPLVAAGDQILPDGEHSYPVVYQPPPGYLAKVRAGDSTLVWVDGGRELFTVRTKIVSCIYPRNEALGLFLRTTVDSLTRSSGLSSSVLVRGTQGRRMARIVEDIGTSSSVERALFFPHVVGKLLELVADGDEDVAPIALKKLVLILSNVYDDLCSKSTYEPLLEHYVHCVYSGVPCAHGSFAAVFARQWAAALSRESESFRATSFKYSWFLFAILFKDMVFEAARKGVLGDPDRAKRVPAATLDEIAGLVDTIANAIAKTLRDDTANAVARNSALNTSTAYFLTRALDIADRGRVFEIFYRYVETIRKTAVPQSQVLALAAIRVLFSHPQAVQLNLARRSSIPTIGSMEAVLMQNHFLSGILLREVSAAMRSPAAEVRDAAQEALFYAVRRFDDSPLAAADPSKRALIFEPFFPFVLDFIDNFPVSRIRDRNIPSEDLRRIKIWLIVFLHIIKCCQPTLKWWWANDVQQRLFPFLDVLVIISDLFKYTGKTNAELIMGMVPVAKDVEVVSPSMKKAGSEFPLGGSAGPGQFAAAAAAAMGGGAAGGVSSSSSSPLAIPKVTAAAAAAASPSITVTASPGTSTSPLLAGNLLSSPIVQKAQNAQKPFRNSGFQPRGITLSENDVFTEIRERTPSTPSARHSIRLVRHKTEVLIARHSLEVNHEKKWSWEAKKRELTPDQLILMVNTIINDIIQYSLFINVIPISIKTLPPK